MCDRGGERGGGITRLDEVYVKLYGLPQNGAVR